MAVATVFGSVNVANAATFNFSFDNEDGPVNGTVSGTIELPDGDFVDQPASSIIVNSAPSELGYTLPFDILANFTVNLNTFTVNGGMIETVVSEFIARSNSEVFALGIASLFSSVGGFDVFSSVVDLDNSSLTFTSANPVGTPEPTSVITLIGVGVLGVASKLKKKA